MKTDTPQTAPILGALIVTALPYAPQLPLWVLAWCAAALGYVYLASRYRWPRPGSVLRTALAFGSVLLVLITGTDPLSHSTGIALLLMATTMKLMEIRSKRDQIVTIFLIYFLAVSGLLVSNSLTTATYMALSILMTTAVLIHLHAPRLQPGLKLRLSGKLMLQALPLTAILFVAFPRIQGSPWGVTGSDTGVSGLGDELNPGAVSRLVLNREIAFRVEFIGRLPDRQNLYWRGVVFWEFDGKTWRRGEHTFPIRLPISASSAVDYIITLEPHYRQWLFALDLPQDSTAGRIQSDYTLMASRPVAQRLRYRVTSETSYNTGALRNVESTALDLPKGSNPRAMALARSWRTRFGSPRQIIDQALAYFRQHEFVYTLNPPPLGSQAVDDFLFNSRKGYCEHFASAFAFLMRAAGIPARLVAGYQGGEMNPYGQYLIVRQSDAHVWVEVWLAGLGWVRVDPTAAVAPDRITLGMEAALSSQERSAVYSFAEYGMIGRAWKPVRLGWDALNNQWNTWILGYSYQRQKMLLSRVGLPVGRWEHIGLASALSLGCLALGFVFIRRHAAAGLLKRPDTVLKSYELFSAKLRRLGLARRPAEGPQDFLRRIAAQHPALQGRAEQIIRLYILLRYGRGATGSDIEKFRGLVKHFDASDYLQPNSRK
jgi:transglutaminase-like putative cysteine protease